MQSTGFYGWKLLAVFWFVLFVNLAFPAYGSSVINAYMATDMQLDRKTLGLIFSVYFVMSGVMAPPAAMCVNKFGVRTTLVLGSVLLLAGSLLMALFVDTGWQAVIVFGFVIGTGVIMGGALAAQTSVASWFIRKRALAMSIMLTAAGVGGFIAAPLLNYVIASSGDWRNGWWLIVGLVCLSLLLAALFVRNKPSDIGQFPDGKEVETAPSPGIASPAAKGVHITTEDWTLRESLLSPTLWVILFSALGFSAGYALFIAHGVVHLMDNGNSAEAAALAVSIMVFANLVGKLIFGVLGDRIEPRYIWGVAVLIFGIGLILAVKASNTIEIYIFAICLGLGFGTSVTCFMTVLSNYFGIGAYASIVGVAMAVQTIVSAIVPLLAGYLYDAYGSYAWSFYGTALWCFVGAVLIANARPPFRKNIPVPVTSP